MGWCGPITPISWLQALLPPDLLDFGESSKAMGPSLYNYKQAADSQTLDHEGLTAKQGPRVTSIGQDWGSATVQLFYLYHRSPCMGLSILSLAYQIPTPDHLSLYTANYDTSNAFVYPQ